MSKVKWWMGKPEKLKEKPIVMGIGGGVMGLGAVLSCPPIIAVGAYTFARGSGLKGPNWKKGFSNAVRLVKGQKIKR